MTSSHRSAHPTAPGLTAAAPARTSSGTGAARRLARTAVACGVALAQLAPVLAPAAWAQGARSRAAAQPATVTVNFVNADIEGVARAMGAILDRQIVVDPRVKGTITLYSEQPLTAREAYLNFLAALRGQGFAVVEAAGLLKVVPEAEAKLQTDTVAVGAAVPARGDQILTQIFRLQHESALGLVTVLRPLITPNNTINANAANNSLVVTDYADNLQRIAKIIAAMDVPATTDLEVIPLRHALALDVAPVLQKLSESPAAPGTAGAAAAGGVLVMPDARTNSLMVRAPNAARLAALRSLIAKLDRPNDAGTAGSGIYVVYLRNADATRLAQILRASFSPDARGGSGSGGTSGGSGGTATTPTATAATPAGTGTNTATSGTSSTSAGSSPQATSPVNAAAAPSTGGFIQADPATNSLIITASEPLYRQLRAVIDQLDGRRAQIYVESMIVEVNADKVAEIGVQWQGLIGNNGDKNGLALGTNFGSTGNLATLTTSQLTGSTSGITLNTGLNLGLIHNFSGTYALGALANFLQTQTDANILSTPNIVALDNEEAKIVVGQNVPFVTGQYTNNNTSNGSVNPFTTVERKDVGLTLRIRPQIGEDGTVRMTIYQENSSVQSGTTSNTNGPTTNKSSIETTVVVNDRQVIVLGGLLKDQQQETVSKVPLLGDAPVIGGLFRNTNRGRTKQNLMVFLRPVVLRTQDATSALSLDRYDLIRAAQQSAQPRPSVVMPNDGPVLPLLAPGEPRQSPGSLPGELRMAPPPWTPSGTAPAAVPAQTAPAVVPAPGPEPATVNPVPAAQSQARPLGATGATGGAGSTPATPTTTTTP